MAEDKLYLSALKDMALAAGAGVADEASFGVANKLNPKGFEDLKKQSPISYGAGQVGSYFIPGLAFTKIGKAAKVARLAQESPLIARILSGAFKTAGTPQALVSKIANMGGSAVTKGIEKAVGSGIPARITGAAVGEAVSGGSQAIAQGAIRNAVGSSESSGEDLANQGTVGALLGGGLGAFKPAIKAAAKGLYSSRQIIDPTANKKTRDFVLKELMDRGIFGGEETFQNVIEKSKSNYGDVIDPMMKPHLKSGVYPEQPLGNIADLTQKIEDIGGTRGSEYRRRMKEFRERLPTDEVSGKTQVSDILERRKSLNEELSSMTRKQRTGEATLPNERDSASSLKDSLDDWQQKFIESKYDGGGEAYNSAKKEYAIGKELESAGNKYFGSSGRFGGSSVVSGINDALNYLPVRTGLGIGLDRLSKDVGAPAGRITDSFMRKPKKEKAKEFDPYEDIDTKSVDENDPYKDI